MLTAPTDEAARAARWLADAAACAGIAPERAGAAAARLEGAWDALLAAICPARPAGQMVMLSLRERADGPCLELVAERAGRVRGDLAAAAARLGLVAETTPGMEGLTRLRLAL